MTQGAAFDLGGKTACITGAGSGIGRAIAEALIEAGCRVFILDSNAEHLGRFLDENPGAQGQLADVGDQEQVETAFLELDRFSDRLDILVNNAGMAGPVASLDEIQGEPWRRTLDVNLSGPILLRPSGRFPHQEGGRRQYHQHGLQRSLYGCSTQEPLCRYEVGLDRLDQDLGDGTRARGHPGECCLPWLSRR